MKVREVNDREREQNEGGNEFRYHNQLKERQRERSPMASAFNIGFANI